MSFITAVLIMAAVIVASGTFPFGDQCILRTDMYHQYAPFFSELRNKLQNGGSLKFTWDLGLGVNFVAIIAYYLASPLNLLVLLISKNHVIELMTLIVLIKTGLCGATMAFYLNSHSRKKNGFGAYIFSLFYALSGYVCAYYWNLMWFDAAAAFPIVVYGAEKLIKGESGIIYGLSLGFCIFTNYYISILICLFLILYFFAYSILEPEADFKSFVFTGIRFAFWSILAAGIAAAVLLPEIYAFKLTASSTSEFPKNFDDYFSLIAELSRHLPMVETEQGLDHWPNIYCGTAVILLFFLYVQNRRIPLKEKIVYAVLSFIFLASFAINVLNFIWHGFHYPNSLPARQSFIYIFLLLFMCFRVFNNLETVKKSDTATAFGVSFAAILLAQEIIKDDAFGFGVFYLGMLLVALYALLIHLYRSGRLSAVTSGVLLFILVITELAANTAYTSITVTSRKAFTADNDDVREMVKLAGELSKGDFYRIERTVRKSKDDGGWLNFPSASIFSSMANADCSRFYRQVGCEASTNAYSITGSTPLVDMLFGIDYELAANEVPANRIMTKAGNSGDTYLYKNNYALSLGFVMPQGMSSEWMLELDDPAIVQNSLCDVLGSEQVLIPVYNDGSSADGECALTIEESGRYFAYEDNFRAGDITVNWSDKKKVFSNLDRSYLMDLGFCESGELINFRAQNSGQDPDISVYRFNENALKQIYDRLSSQQLEITEYGDDYVKGTVKVDTKAMGYSSDRAEMLLTTPYDKGWTVLVDGKKAEIYKGLDTFISFYISSGEHEIEMHYEPEGLKAGLIISGISLLIFAAVIALELRKKKRAQSSAQENNNDRNSCNEIESVSDNEFCNEFCNEFQTNSCNGSCMDSSNKALIESEKPILEDE